jgi:hypothetical protein
MLYFTEFLISLSFSNELQYFYLRTLTWCSCRKEHCIFWFVPEPSWDFDSDSRLRIRGRHRNFIPQIIIIRRVIYQRNLLENINVQVFEDLWRLKCIKIFSKQVMCSCVLDVVGAGAETNSFASTTLVQLRDRAGTQAWPVSNCGHRPCISDLKCV